MKKSNKADAESNNGESAIVVIEPGHSILDQGTFDWWETTERGIAFKTGTPRGVWLGAMQSATAMYEDSGRLHFRSLCILGDALNFGENEYGEEFAQAIDDTRTFMRLSMKTIQNASWIMAAIPATRRRETLTLSHHEVVAGLDDESEQDEFLKLAEDEGLSVSGLKKAIAERHPKTKKGAARKSSKADLEAEEGLYYAAEKIETWFAAYEAGDGAVPLKDWTESRKKKWAALTGISKIARRMGVSR